MGVRIGVQLNLVYEITSAIGVDSEVVPESKRGGVCVRMGCVRAVSFSNAGFLKRIKNYSLTRVQDARYLLSVLIIQAETASHRYLRYQSSAHVAPF
jgi:hypothetical protein